MLFNTALFSSILLSPVVLAVPSGLGAPIAHRGESSQGSNRLERDTGVGSNPVNYSSSLSEAWLSQLDQGVFTSITGTIIVPSASSPNGSSVLIWVALDGISCSDVTLATGLSVTVSDQGSVSYSAWYKWTPDIASQSFSDSIPIYAGDAVKLTVDVSFSTSGTVTIENLTKPQVVSQTLTSSTPLCGQDVAWGISKYQWNDGTLMPLADVGAVTFMDAFAFGRNTWFSPFGANTTDMVQYGRTVTNVTTGETSVTIRLQNLYPYTF